MNELSIDQCVADSPLALSYSKVERAQTNLREKNAEIVRLTEDHRKLQLWLLFATLETCTPEHYATETARLALTQNSLDAAKKAHRDLSQDVEAARKGVGRIVDEYRLLLAEFRARQYNQERFEHLLREHVRLTGVEASADMSS